MRAISVRVNDVVGVAGFVLPGMRVDVLVTGRPPGRQDTVTRTVLQNIAVLSAGQTIQTDGKSQSIVAPVVTLLVKPQEAEAVTLANTEGHIQLVLRNSNDQQVAPTQGRGLQEIFGGAAPAEVPAPRPVMVRSRAETAAAVVPSPVPATPAPKEEEEQMVMIRGKVKTVELFGKEAAVR
jgi:pilus assembly protein CpaB